MKKLLLSKLETLLIVLLSILNSDVCEAQTIEQKIANKQQLTNIPTIYLTVPDAIGKDINSVLTKTGNVAEYHAATIQVVDNSGSLENFTDSKLEIKVRGNSTAQDSKRPYRMKFGKDVKDAAGNVIETHKHDMLGLGYSKRNWTLLTNHKDKSLLHNALTYYVGKAVGMDFCPGYKFVDLVINGEYRGNYQLSDHVEVGKNRVDVDEDTGWFIEAARGDMVEEPLVEAAGLRMSIKNPEPATADEVAKLKADVSGYFTRLNHFWGVYGTPCSMEEFVSTSGWTQYIDEESLAKFYVGINLTDDYDGFMTVKMYREADGKLKFGPLWDKDLAYGNWQNHGKLAEEYQPGYTFCDHMARMMTDPYFVKKVHDLLHEVVDAGFVKKMQDQIYAMGTEITESQKLNQGKWWTCDNYPAAQKDFADYIAEHTAFFVDAIDKKYVDMKCAELGERPALGGGTGPDTGTGGSAGPEFEKEIVGTYDSGSFTIPASSFNSKATSVEVTVMRSATEGGFNGIYAFNGTPWNGSSLPWTTGQSVTIGISDAKDITAICSNGITFSLGGGSPLGTITTKVVNHGSNTPDVSCTHTYTTDNCATDADGILHRTCSKCGAEESDVNYYEFTVYPESATTQTVIAKSWTPAANKPNSIATVKITSGLEKNVPGYNIVNSKKNADGNQTCADFRLTDGHPYYSDKKFVAAKATYTRTLAANEEYGMMILPFKHQNAENADAEFYHIDKVEAGKIYLTAIDPSVEGNASAYLPVIFKRKAGKTSVTVTGTDITVKKTTTTVKTNSTYEGWTIIGAVENTSANGSGLYNMSDAKTGTVANVSSISIAPYRAYLSTTTSAPQSLTLVLPSGEEAEITLSSLVNAIEKLKTENVTVKDIETIVNKLLGK